MSKFKDNSPAHNLPYTHQIPTQMQTSSKQNPRNNSYQIYKICSIHSHALITLPIYTHQHPTLLLQASTQLSLPLSLPKMALLPRCLLATIAAAVLLATSFAAPTEEAEQWYRPGDPLPPSEAPYNLEAVHHCPPVEAPAQVEGEQKWYRPGVPQPPSESPIQPHVIDHHKGHHGHHGHHSPAKAPAPGHHGRHSPAKAPAPGHHGHHSPAKAPAPGHHEHHSPAKAPAKAPAPGHHGHHSPAKVPAPGHHAHHSPAKAPAPGHHAHHSPAPGHHAPAGSPYVIHGEVVFHEGQHHHSPSPAEAPYYSRAYAPAPAPTSAANVLQSVSVVGIVAILGTMLLI